jgi:citrate synthase
MAMALEKVALRTTTSSPASSTPNVDFYSGIILKAMGIPTSMFTVIFAVARTVGWVSQWKEMVEDPGAAHRPPAADLHGVAEARLQPVARRG